MIISEIDYIWDPGPTDPKNSMDHLREDLGSMGRDQDLREDQDLRGITISGGSRSKGDKFSDDNYREDPGPMDPKNNMDHIRDDLGEINFSDDNFREDSW